MPAPPPATSSPARAARVSVDLIALAGVLLAGALALMQPLPASRQPPPGPATARLPGGRAPARVLPGDAAAACALESDGFLRGRFFGAVSLAADWSGAGLACGGMRRPGGDGVRLYFAGEMPGGGRLSVLLGIDSPPDALTGGDRPVNVTVIDERDGRFFSSGGPGRCWARVNAVTALPGAAGKPGGTRVTGLVWCVGALPSVGDQSSVTLGDLEFAGLIGPDEG